MAASIEDVARRAGVSIATVSRALRGLPDVARATRDRVLEAAAELDYVASPFAARLASGRTATVGVVVPFVNRWFFGEVIDTVETSLRRAGFDLLLYNLGDEAGRSRFFDLLPMRKRVDAVLVVSLVLSDDEIAALRSMDCPVGLLGFTRSGFLSTRIDDVASARTAVEHLIGLGHRRIGLIGGDTDDPMRFTPPLHRADGYHEALAAEGVGSDPDLEVLGYFTVPGGEQACRTLMALPDRPTAIFAESDEMAYGALGALRRLRLRVPEDVAVIGFDDHPTAELMDLTTMQQPVPAQALDAVTRLLAAIAADGEVSTDVVLPTEIVVRGSTGCEQDGCTEPVLMLVDAANLYFRAFHALPESITAPDGRPVNAIRGYLDMTAALIDKRRPTRHVACLDYSWRPAFRVALIPSYKAHRVADDGGEEVPDTLAPQVPLLIEVLAALGLATAGASGFEADDVIATLAERDEDAVEIVSGDRDLLALASGRITVLYTGKGLARMAAMGPDEVLAAYGVPAEHYADFAILRGDPSDGLPGVPGIGQKTAAALVTRFGAIEQIVAAAQAGSGGFPAGAAAKVRAALEYLAVAPDAVRGRLDVPVDTLSDALPAAPADAQRLVELSAELGIESSLNRLLTAIATARR